MRLQAPLSGKRGFFGSARRDLPAAYGQLDRAVARQPWLAQGSVNVVAPKSPGGHVTYTWTRKVRAKTITVALSAEQAAAFRGALAAHRRIEAALRRLRQVSQAALLSELPGVTKRRSVAPKSARRKPPQKGLK